MEAPCPAAFSMVEGELVGGRYRLLHPIGAGAMGTVWAARHELLGREFAIKFPRLPSRAEGEARKRFLEEAQIAGKLRHPNIVDVADFGEIAEGQGLYLAMELLSGQSLAEHISAHGPLPVTEAIAIAIEVCRGLSAAHAIGVIHRDVKPENIFLARGSSGGVVPKLLDFGISQKASPDDPLAPQPGQPFGTPAYMSPEQAVGEEDIDQASDIWAMGVVLHEMTTGQHPFVAPSYAALMACIAEQPPAPLAEDVPSPVRDIIRRCLEKRREDRYWDAGALREDLEKALASIGASDVGQLKIERLRVLSPVTRDPSGRGLPVLGSPAPHRAAHVRWLLFGGLGMGVIAGLVLMWIADRRVPDPSGAAAPAPAVAAAGAQQGAAQPQPSIAASTATGSLVGVMPSAASSTTAGAKAPPLASPRKSPQTNTARKTKVDAPGF